MFVKPKFHVILRKKGRKKYNPETVGYYRDDKNPRIQLEPRGERGYIELVAVKAL